MFNTGQANFEDIATITLKKGNYVLTLSFLAKVTNSHMYIHFQQGQILVTNSGFYVPNVANFIPMTIRKVYRVSNE